MSPGEFLALVLGGWFFLTIIVIAPCMLSSIVSKEDKQHDKDI